MRHSAERSLGAGEVQGRTASVAYDGNLIGLHQDTADLIRRLMEERGLWRTPSLPHPCGA